MKNYEVVNDLIEINNDRVAGYTKAAGKSSDKDLQDLFEFMVTQSREFINELRRLVRKEGEEPVEGTTLKGKIYRAWMEVKISFSGNDRKAVLASCEYGEDAAQKAYTSALESDDLSTEVRSVIIDQQEVLRRSHDRIKQLRDKEVVG